MIVKFDNVLVLSPHADDAEFGCGGTIARLVENGATIHHIVFSKATRSLPADFPEYILVEELRLARIALGLDTGLLHVFDFAVRDFPDHRQAILEKLIAARDAIRPNLVLTPSLNDVHQDHSTVAHEAVRAFKRTTILGYELPWNNLTFNRQLYVPLKGRHIGAKLAALHCYASQRHRNYNDSEYIESRARVLGVDINVPYAEVFEVYRCVL